MGCCGGPAAVIPAASPLRRPACLRPTHEQVREGLHTARQPLSEAARRRDRVPGAERTQQAGREATDAAGRGVAGAPRRSGRRARAGGELLARHDLVFAQPNGTPIDSRRDWAEWKALLQTARVRDARVHDGRHTAGTLLIEQGVHARVVMEILGHSDIRLTQRYTHVASPAAADAAARMGRALWG
jgi:integrase